MLTMMGCERIEGKLGSANAVVRLSTCARGRLLSAVHPQRALRRKAGCYLQMAMQARLPFPRGNPFHLKRVLAELLLVLFQQDYGPVYELISCHSTTQHVSTGQREAGAHGGMHADLRLKEVGCVHFWRGLGPEPE